MAGKKGRSGGARPGAGRKGRGQNRVKRELAEAARQYTEESLKALVRIMRKTDAPESAVVTAATAILDRGHGKPRQAVDHNIAPLDLAKLTDDDLRLLERLALRATATGADSDGAAAPGGTGEAGDHGTRH